MEVTFTCPQCGKKLTTWVDSEYRGTWLRWNFRRTTTFRGCVYQKHVDSLEGIKDNG